MEHKELKYTYLDSFKITPFELHTEEAEPVRLVTAKWLIDPDGLLTGRSTAALCSFGDSEIILDFGEERVGFFQMEVDTVECTEISVLYGEYYEELFADKSLELSWYKHPSDSFTANIGSNSLRSNGRRAFRFVRILVPKCMSDIYIGKISVILVNYPVKHRGSFRCSDPLLNRIWDISANTIELCMQQFYEDGIKRDGLLWIGDARVEVLCNYFAFGDLELARKSLYMIACTQREDGALPACASKAGGHQHPFNIGYMPGVAEGVGQWILDNYCTDFIGMLLEYYEYSGDMKVLEELWPFAVRTMYYLINDVSTDPVNIKNFITDENVKVRDSWWASEGTFLMQLYNASLDMEKMSDILSDDHNKGICIEYRQKLEELILRKYFLAEQGVFTDTPSSGSVGLDAGWHVNSFAVLGGFPVNGQKTGRFLERLQNMEDIAYPIAGFMKYWVLKAMMDSGMHQEAMNDIREYWGFMLNTDATTCWEKLDLKNPQNVTNNPNVSRCHGWTAGPCVLLPQYVLGFRSVEPGCTKIILKPAIGGLLWAEGTVPTPMGDVFIHWDAGKELKGCVILPEGITGEVIINDYEGMSEKIISIGPGINRID